MGFGKKKRQVREAIDKWKCFGYLGYGQGRAVSQFGAQVMGDKSACGDLCSRANDCRMKHHEMMNERYPQLAQLLAATTRIAHRLKKNPDAEVLSAMHHAADLGMDEAVSVKHTLALFKVKTMTDHHRCGEFENIQDGMDKVAPGTRNAVTNAAKIAS